nr:MAG TPA: baseplate protein [Caudoviricetes sp.]
MNSFVNLLEIIYPIGSCYFSTNSTSPSELIGGTWEQMTGGVLGLVGSTGVASAGENGGSTKISIDQLPSHDHLGDAKKPLQQNQGWEYIVHIVSFGDDPNGTVGSYTRMQSGKDVGRFVSAGDESIKVGGGGKTTFLLTPLSMGGSVLPRFVCW